MFVAAPCPPCPLTAALTASSAHARGLARPICTHCFRGGSPGLPWTAVALLHTTPLIHTAPPAPWHVAACSSASNDACVVEARGASVGAQRLGNDAGRASLGPTSAARWTAVTAGSRTVVAAACLSLPPNTVPDTHAAHPLGRGTRRCGRAWQASPPWTVGASAWSTVRAGPPRRNTGMERWRWLRRCAQAGTVGNALVDGRRRACGWRAAGAAVPVAARRRGGLPLTSASPCGTRWCASTRREVVFASSAELLSSLPARRQPAARASHNNSAVLSVVGAATASRSAPSLRRRVPQPPLCNRRATRRGGSQRSTTNRKKEHADSF